MHRFFHAPIDERTTTITIAEKKEIHHITNVLRMKPGDALEVFDGDGASATARIASLKKNMAVLAVSSVVCTPKKKTRLVLACAIPKKSKFETIIEKCTELGVDEIIPLKTTRTTVALNEKRAAQKTQRYQTVAVNAAKQSRRVTIPRIHPVTSFDATLAAARTADIALIPCLLGKRKNLTAIFRQQAPHDKKIMFFIGPEGDFTEDEVRRALKAGCIPVTLGETILKVETAAIAVIALTNFFLDDKK